MPVNLVRVPRSMMIAFLLGLALTPLSPDTGSVSATTSIPHRIDAAHNLAAGEATAQLR
jgi:hypothetical protein